MTIKRPKNRLILRLSVVLLMAGVFWSLHPAPAAHAVSAANWRAGRIIDDGVFFNKNAMTVQEIQSFLSAKVPTCDTNGTQLTTRWNSAAGRYYTRAEWGATQGSPAPYTCLKDYIENPTTHANNYHSPGTPVAGGLSAAQIIWNVGQQYGINPEVLIVTLQKEQGLVTDDWPYQTEYIHAMGANCPDTPAGCDPAYSGFQTQVDRGAYLFNYYKNHITEFNFNVGSNFILWNVQSTGCGGSTVNIENIATAMLYIYTPYQPNAASVSAFPGQGNGCSAYGNRNFWYYFNNWFGASLASDWNYSYISSSNPLVNMEVGQRVSGNTITIQNIGTSSWYADGSVPVGQHPVRLSVRGYENVPFADQNDPNWLGTSNQIKMTPATVAPGENATFTFNLVGPMRTIPYRYIFFVPVVDGVTFMRDLNMGFSVVSKAPAYAPVSQQSAPNPLLPNQLATSSVTIQNIGTSSWYADGSVPVGQHPVRLSVRGYENVPFADQNDPNWLGTSNQIKMTPATVAPGENATFTFNLVGPMRALNRSLYFVPVLDGVAVMDDKSIGMGINTPQPVANYNYVTANNPPSVMTAGSSATITLTIQNTGNVVWQPETFNGDGKSRLRLSMRRPTYHNSSFVDLSNGWVNASQIRYSGATVMPGQNATLSFKWKAPTTPGNYVDYFAPVLDGYFEMRDIGMGFAVQVNP